ncbi:MobA-like NTP transferase domain-containing protein [Exophiala viscosa]|uniref:MobA-like NTP transferase domain-containing protein n=1 Tax=Exophiala viscosa TaxID=2486360 RepID=A0AAN6E020_9EURO|nr:MobA-like NTP transferase domain-containing protein [Exophiala viscosa]KAI1621247.1 MobA-like NTP transferase domain-containing protein [Exophiala viscosa]
MAELIHIRSLILAGGQSSRMGSPKCLLPFPRPSGDIPLILQTLLLHLEAAHTNRKPRTSAIMISVRNEAQKKEIEDALKPHLDDHPVQVEFVLDMQADCGPVMGLVAAHKVDEQAHWMVTGCDYPLLETASLLQLSAEHSSAQNAITCFRNHDGWTEPLLAIWSPYALERLLRMSSSNPHIGPSRVIRAFVDEERGLTGQPAFSNGVGMVSPQDELWIKSVDTPAEWDAARKKIYAEAAAHGT